MRSHRCRGCNNADDSIITMNGEKSAEDIVLPDDGTEGRSETESGRVLKGVPMQDSRNQYTQKDLFELGQEEGTESPGPEQCAVPAEKEMEGKASGNTIMNELCRNTLAYIVSYKTMEDAFRKVARNRGSGGVDGMEYDELMPYYGRHWKEIRASLLEGSYKPSPVRRVEIPKDNGKTRKLGIPTLVDRGVQQAIATVLSWIYEPIFSDSSFGFRPGRSAHDALRRCLEYANEGYEWVVDMDLEKYFDTVPQSKLLEMISQTIKDGRVISLLYRFMKAGVMENGAVARSESGIPQGGPLSPILANIMLDRCDKELEKRGLRFVRYADDMMIFARSERSAKRIMESITRFIEKKLGLRVNREKTVARRITDNVRFLGHSFWKGNEGKIALGIHEKSMAKLKDSLKELTARKSQLSWEELKLKLRQKITGWVGYFRYANAKRKLQALDEWLRHRIRCLIFRRYWRVRSRYAFFVRNCNVPHEDALRVASARQGFWAFSGYHMVSKWVSNNLLRRAGYTFLMDVYERRYIAIL